MNALTVERRILGLMESTGYNLTQTNGQRIYGPDPQWPENEAPPKHSEVFVGRLPRNLFEDELVPLFSRIGRIYQMRLMVDFSGTNRGFAFVTYGNKYDARNAVKVLNNYQIRPNHHIGVIESVDNCRLFIGNLPLNLSRQQVFQVMSENTVGVVSVILHYNSTKRLKSGAETRGFAFIEYESHRDAAMARRKLLPQGNFHLFGAHITVDWAIPEPKGDKHVMSSVTVLFARYLNYEASEEMIRSVFSLNNKLNVIKVKRIKNYSFIHYKDRNSAEFALNCLSAMDLRNCPLSEKGGQPLEVKWSIPPDTANHLNNDKLTAGAHHSFTFPNESLNPMAPPFNPHSAKHSIKCKPFERLVSNWSQNKVLDSSKDWVHSNEDIYWLHKMHKSLPSFQ